MTYLKLYKKILQKIGLYDTISIIDALEKVLEQHKILEHASLLKNLVSIAQKSSAKYQASENSNYGNARTN